MIAKLNATGFDASLAKTNIGYNPSRHDLRGDETHLIKPATLRLSISLCRHPYLDAVASYPAPVAEAVDAGGCAKLFILVQIQAGPPISSSADDAGIRLKLQTCREQRALRARYRLRAVRFGVSSSTATNSHSGNSRRSAVHV